MWSKKHYYCCCQQAEGTNYAKVEKLISTLERQDERLLPKFRDALADAKQTHIVRILMGNGLDIMSLHLFSALC